MTLMLAIFLHLFQRKIECLLWCAPRRIWMMAVPDLRWEIWQACPNYVASPCMLLCFSPLAPKLCVRLRVKPFRHVSSRVLFLHYRWTVPCLQESIRTLFS